MAFIKQNWRQCLTVAASGAVAGLLLTHKIEPATAVGIGAALAAFGIHLPSVVYKAGDK
jgi:hypothetical protein